MRFSSRPITAIMMALLLASAAPLDSGVRAAESASVTLTWTAPGDDGAGGTASAYDIRYATSPITEANWNAATEATGEPSPQGGGSAESFVVTGLAFATTYYFAIKTEDEYGNLSSLSNIASVTTAQEDNPPGQVADLTVSGATDSTLTLVWTAPGDDSTSGTAAGYDIRYSQSPITPANWDAATTVNNEPTPAPAGTQQQYTLAGLSMATTYFVAIRAVDDVGNWSDLSNVASGSTGGDVIPPDAITDLEAQANNPS